MGNNHDHSTQGSYTQTIDFDVHHEMAYFLDYYGKIARASNLSHDICRRPSRDADPWGWAQALTQFGQCARCQTLGAQAYRDSVVSN